MRRTLISLTLAPVIFVSSCLLLSACHKGLTSSDTAIAGEQALEAIDVPVAVPPMRKDGARAWAQNCMRCHNVRDPQERSDRQWEIIVHHMRVRANLTADEHRLILEFLKAAN